MQLKITLAVIAGGAVTCLAGPVVPVQQYRAIDAEGFVHNAVVSGIDQDGDSMQANDFGLFDRSVSVDVSVGQMYSGASSSQQSFISPWTIAAVGSTSVTLSMVFAESASQATAESAMEMTFDVLEPTPITFQAQVSELNDLLGVDFYNADASFYLSTGWGVSEEIDYTGTLFPGRYTVYAFSQTYLEGYPQSPPQTAVSSWGLRVQVVPGSGALAALALGGLVSCRRRR